MKLCNSKWLITFVVLSVLWLAEAKQLSVTQAQSSQTESPTSAQKIDEYGKLGSCDHSARLDNFAIELMNEPTLRGFIVSYNARGSKSDTAQHWLDYARHYLVKSRGIDNNRIITVNGGRHEQIELKTELWIVPKDAAPPIEVADSDAAQKQVSGKIAEYHTDDQTYHHGEDTNGVSPLVDITFSKFAEALHREPKLQGFVVVFSGKDSLPGAWRRIARRDKETIAVTYKLRSNRLEMVHGGASDEDKVELWALPQGETPPVQKAIIEKKITAAFRLSGDEIFGINDEQSEKWRRDNLADLLKSDEQTIGCIIFHPPSPTPDGEESEDPPADMQKVAEAQRVVLIKKHKIEPHRIIVMAGKADEYGAGSLETWIVPQGAPLPDPYAVTNDESTEISEQVISENNSNTPPQ